MLFNSLRKLLIFFLLLFLHAGLPAQIYQVSGRVVDSETKSPLAFVNIIANNSIRGTSTDIDGRFKIITSFSIKTLKLTYVGYQPTIVEINGKTDNLLIRMPKTEIQLTEVVIKPGINPAHRIINKVIENRDRNNPEKNNSFTYTSYNKLVFTGEFPGNFKSDSTINDTMRTRIEKFLNKSHIMLMESVSKRYFMPPGNNYEKVEASRISGLQDPIFGFLSTQIQSFSFYKDMISISDKNYISPISNGSTSKYYFQIEDTTYSGNDTIFTISFRPLKHKNFDGLKGVISINTNGYAIQNVIAEPNKASKGLSIKIQHKYEMIDSTKWFPVQLNTDIRFKMASLNGLYLVGSGRTYIKDIVLNPKLKKSMFSNTEVDVDENAGRKSESYWVQYRYDSLTLKDLETYRKIDSLGKALKLERRINILQSILLGRIPIRFIDIDINRIMNYNEYEGYRLGLGLFTNRRLSKYFNTGGYFAYGFSDKEFKYGFEVNFNLEKFHDSWLSARYMNDLTESGKISFFDDKIAILSNEQIRDYFTEKMDKTETKQIALGFTMLKYLKASFSFSQITREPAFNYGYGFTKENMTVVLNRFHLAELTVGLRYAYKETYIRTTRFKMSLGTDFPVLWLQYTRGFNNILAGQYTYNKVEAKIEKSFYFKYLGRMSFLLTGGYTDRSLPYMLTYNGNAGKNSIYMYAPLSFVTMKYNEFACTKYAALYFTHNFGKLLVNTKYFAPEIAVSTNILFGDFEHRDKHFLNNAPWDFKVPTKGYFESGLMINGILKIQFYSLGIGAFYRYGPYAYNKVWDDLALKWSLLISF